MHETSCTGEEFNTRNEVNVGFGVNVGFALVIAAAGRRGEDTGMRALKDWFARSSMCWVFNRGVMGVKGDGDGGLWIRTLWD